MYILFWEWFLSRKNMVYSSIGYKVSNLIMVKYIKWIDVL